MTPNRMVALGAFLGALAVLLGAFAAHALQGSLEPRLFAAFETGVRYHVYHALALVLCGLLGRRDPAPTPGALRASAWAFAVGILLFSGSLYLMATTGIGWLGAVTPLGGIAFVVGWVLMGCYGWRQAGADRPSD